MRSKQHAGRLTARKGDACEDAGCQVSGTRFVSPVVVTVVVYLKHVCLRGGPGGLE